MHVEKGIEMWDFETGLIQAHYLQPKQFNYTYYNMGGDFKENQVSYSCNCGDYGEADGGSE